MSGAEARAAILAAATAAFAEHGFDGAKTLQIARAAQITEAVMYRHFPSKEALYRAVLRLVVRSQNASFAPLRLTEPSTSGLLTSLERYFRNSYSGSHASNATAMQFLLRSIAHRGDFARFTYRRATRLSILYLEPALAAVKLAGDLATTPIDVKNAVNFIEHVGAMMFASRLAEPELIPYQGGEEQAVRDAVRFCARGIGISDIAVDRYFSTTQTTVVA